MSRTIRRLLSSARATATSVGDLLAVLALSGVASLVLALFDPVSPARLVIGVPFLLFVPGYVTVCAFFGSFAPVENGMGERRVAEGLLYAVGLSVAIVPLLGRMLVATPAGLSGTRLVGAVLVYTVTVGLIAAIRRHRSIETRDLPADSRLQTRADERTLLAKRPTGITLAVLVVGALFATGAVSYAVADAGDRGSYSELYLLAENESGDLQATEYPQAFVAGEPRPLTVVVENHAESTRNYTVVAQLQRLDSGTTTVTERSRIDRFSAQLSPGTEFRAPHQIRPQMTGERLRVTYLLYRGDVPAEPTEDNAAKTVYLWITVTADTDENQSKIGTRRITGH